MSYIQRNVAGTDEFDDVSGNGNKLTFSAIVEIDPAKASPNPPKRRAFLEFYGEAVSGYGDLVKRRRRYEISAQEADRIVEAFDAFRRFDDSRKAPAILREYMEEGLSDKIVAALRVTPKGERLVGLVGGLGVSVQMLTEGGRRK